MAKKQNNVTYADWLRVSIQRVAVTNFILLIGYCIQIMALDAWHVIVPEIVLQRWLAVSITLSMVAVMWYLAHNRNNSIATFKRILFGIILSDIAFAAFNIYVQRGMSSRAIFLFAIPIIISAVLLNRAAIYATAIISAAAYIGTAVAYFVLNFNEGYKAELYGEIGFYALALIALAGLLSTLVRFGGNTNDA